MTALAPALQAYFTDRLIGQRDASPNTIAAYRDHVPAAAGLRRPADRQATQHAGHRRPRRAADRRVPGPPRTRPRQQRPRPATTGSPRSTRCSATSPCTTPSTPRRSNECSPSRPNAPNGNLVTYLTEPEVDALLAACDQSTWTGRRDHAMLALTIQTGLRISELAGLTRADVTLTAGAHVHTIGKGRKERRTPLVPSTRAVLKAWLTERRGAPDDPLFPTTTGTQAQPRRHRTPPRPPPAPAAAQTAPRSRPSTSPCTRCGTPPRCGCCIAGNDITVIALWLGHEQVATTNDLPARRHDPQENAPSTAPDRLAAKPGRYRPPTPSSPSSRASDYADPYTAITLPCNGLPRRGRHNAEVGIIVLMPTSA